MMRELEGAADEGAPLSSEGSFISADLSLSTVEADILRLAAIVESSDDAIISKQLDGTITSWNAGAERLFGYRPEEIIGRSILTLIPADRQDEEISIINRIRSGDRVEHFETIRRHKSGALLDISLTVSPIKRADGTIIGASKIARDITQRKRADALLQQQAERLEVLNRVARITSQDLDLHRIVQAVTDEATAISGARFGAFFYNTHEGENYSLRALSGMSRETFERIGIPGNSALFAATISDQETVRLADIRKDPRYDRSAARNGNPPVVSYLAVPLSRRGEVIGGLFFGHEEPDRFSVETESLITAIASQAAVAIDNARFHQAAQTEIAQRKEVQEAKDLLLHEIKHRVKNTLATIQALASQTLKETPEHERRAFIDRLHALSDAHDLLTQNDWNTIDLRTLARRSLRPFAGSEAKRVLFAGPAVQLSPNKALILTMILHELGTNAVKYGALSVDTGRVEVDWEQKSAGDRSMLRLVWLESGGPRVSPPRRQGFGSRMIVSALHGNDGSATLNYRETGLEAVLELWL